MMTERPTPPAPRLDTGYFSHVGQDAALWISANGLKVAISFAAGALIVLALGALRQLGMRLCLTDRTGSGWPGIFGRAIAQTKLWFMVPLAAKLVAGGAAPPPGVDHFIGALFTVAMALQAALWARELVLGLIDRRAGHDPDHPALGSAMGLIRILVSAALFAIALVLILDNLGVNVTGLVAGLGIGGIAIGLAAQGIFSDLFAALSIIFDKPFRIGELVKWDTGTGTVEQIGLKTTRIRSITGELVIVSNSTLLQKELRNLSAVTLQRMTLSFGIVYQTPNALCAEIPPLLEAIVAADGQCQFARCGIAGFGPSGIDYDLVFDVESAEPKDAADARNRVALRILEAFTTKGIAFAYPTQTTFTAAPDGTMVMPWAPPLR